MNIKIHSKVSYMFNQLHEFCFTNYILEPKTKRLRLFKLNPTKGDILSGIKVKKWMIFPRSWWNLFQDIPEIWIRPFYRIIRSQILELLKMYEISHTKLTTKVLKTVSHDMLLNLPSKKNLNKLCCDVFFCFSFQIWVHSINECK